MDKKNAPAKERIFDAAVGCLEKYGLKKLTIRLIAHEASVNSAAINYYFGTKEALIDLVMRKTLEEMVKMPAELFEAAAGTLGDRLENFFIGFLDGLFQWRGITRAHLYAPLMEGRYDTEFFRKFGAFFEALVGQVTGVDPGFDLERLRLMLIEIFAAVLLPALMPKAFVGFSSLDFDDAATRRAYVHDVVVRFFPPARP